MDPEAAARALALLSLPGVGSGRAWVLVAKHEDVTLAYEAACTPSAKLDDLPEEQVGKPGERGDRDDQVEEPARKRSKLPDGSWERLPGLLPAARAAVARASGSGLDVLTIYSKGYPPMLQEGAPDPPLVLFVRGRLPDQLLAGSLGELMAGGVVGTRSASPEGLAEGRVLGRSMAAAGVVVVSGLALGVDAAAHRGALEAGPSGAPTVAVLGGAHDRLHPKENERLAEQIVERGGAVVSEYPPGVHPTRGSFLHRNRVIAGLSRAVVVVEAGARSGALSTARCAAEAGRYVLAVPARPSDKRRAGNLQLLREGAAPLVDLTDLADTFSSAAPVSEALRAKAGLRDGGATGLVTIARTGVDGRSTRPVVSGTTSGVTNLPPADASQQRNAVVDAALLDTLVGSGDVSFDALLTALGRTTSGSLTPAELAGALVRLELAGAISRLEDGRFAASGPLFAALPEAT